MPWVLAVLVMAGCGVPTDDAPEVADDDRVPFALLAPGPTGTTAPTEDPDPAQVTLCLQRGDRLVTVRHALPRAATGLAAILGSGPTPVERGSGLRSALFDDDLVEGVDVVVGVARVALSDSFATGTPTDQLFAVAQIVCTLTAQRGVGQVSFTLEGAPVGVPRGDGSVSSSPVSRDDYGNLLE
jgi:hypothetical protein